MKKLKNVAFTLLCALLMSVTGLLAACGEDGETTPLQGLGAEYGVMTVGQETTVSGLADGAYNGYIVTVTTAGHYEIVGADGQTYAIGTGLTGTVDNVTLTGTVTPNNGVYTLTATTYYVQVTGNGAFTLKAYVKEETPPALDADYAVMTVGTETTVSGLTDGAHKGYKLTVAEAGEYEIVGADGQTYAIGTGLAGTVDNVTLTGTVAASDGVYTLAATTYYVQVTGNGAFTLRKYIAPEPGSDYAVMTVGTEITVSGLADGAYKGYKVTVAEAGEYEIVGADGQTYAIGTGLDGTADNATLTGAVTPDNGVYTLEAKMYYVHVTGNGALTLRKYVAPPTDNYEEKSLNTRIASTGEGNDLYKFTISDAGLYQVKTEKDAAPLTAADIKLGTDFDGATLTGNTAVSAAACVYYVEAGTCYMEVSAASEFRLVSYVATAIEDPNEGTKKLVKVSDASAASPAIYSYTPNAKGEYQLVRRTVDKDNVNQYEKIVAGVAVVGTTYNAKTGTLQGMTAVQDRENTYVLAADTTYYLAINADGDYILDVYSAGAYWTGLSVESTAKDTTSTGATSSYQFTVSQNTVNTLYQVVIAEAMETPTVILGESFDATGKLTKIDPETEASDTRIIYELAKGKTYYMQISGEATFKVAQYSPYARYQFAGPSSKNTVKQEAIMDGTAYYSFGNSNIWVEDSDYKLTVTGANMSDVKFGYIFTGNKIDKVLTAMTPKSSDATTAVYTLAKNNKVEYKYCIEIANATTSTTFTLEEVEKPVEIPELEKDKTTYVGTDMWMDGGESMAYTLTVAAGEKLKLTADIPSYSGITITIKKDETTVATLNEDNLDPVTLTEAGTYNIAVANDAEANYYGDTTIKVERVVEEPEPESTVAMGENRVDASVGGEYILVVKAGETYEIQVDETCMDTQIEITCGGKTTANLDGMGNGYTKITTPGVYTITVTSAGIFSDAELVFTVTKK